MTPSPTSQAPSDGMSPTPASRPPAAVTGLTDADNRRIAQALHHSRSPNTRAAYAHAWRRFSAWAQGRGAPPLPATPERVAAYLTRAGGRPPAQRRHHPAAPVRHRGGAPERRAGRPHGPRGGPAGPGRPGPGQCPPAAAGEGPDRRGCREAGPGGHRPGLHPAGRAAPALRGGGALLGRRGTPGRRQREAPGPAVQGRPRGGCGRGGYVVASCILTLACNSSSSVAVRSAADR